MRIAGLKYGRRDPAPNAPERFRCLVQVFFANGQNGFLNVETPQQFMAIAAMLQVPGQLFFQAGAGQDRNVLIKQG